MRVLACLARGILPKAIHKELRVARSTITTQISEIEERMGENWLHVLIFRYLPDPASLGEYDPASSQEAMGRKWRG